MGFSSTAEKRAVKLRLKAHCLAILQERVDTARQAMEAAQDSANNEEKSSAGDKYETGRAMSQTDRDRSAGQMDDAMMELIKLRGIDCERLYEQADTGAVVVSNSHLYFIAAGLGKIIHEGHEVVLLSPNAPLTRQLRGRSKGDEVTFNGANIRLIDVF